MSAVVLDELEMGVSLVGGVRLGHQDRMIRRSSDRRCRRASLA